MINNIQIGEIIRIKDRDWILVETPHNNGNIAWEQPTLVLLDKVLTGINKKPYYKKRNIEIEKIPTRRFNAIKCKVEVKK